MKIYFLLDILSNFYRNISINVHLTQKLTRDQFCFKISEGITARLRALVFKEPYGATNFFLWQLCSNKCAANKNVN